MNRILPLILATTSFFGAGCAEPPSCQQAMEHYYSEGCSFFNFSTNQETSRSQAIAGCYNFNVYTSDDCRDELEDWFQCLADVSSSCDCTRESDKYFSCR